MFRTNRYIGPFVIAAALIVPLAGTGCAARVTYRDEYHGDYHRWDDGEVHAYHVWINERHYQYRDYKKLDREQQNEYWAWRHDHPGRY